MSSASTGRIGILVKTYPKLSETFIAGEIRSLEESGLDLHIFALQRPTDQVFHTATVRSPVSYVSELKSARLLPAFRAQFSLLRRQPGRYLATLVFLWRRQEDGRMAEFFQAVCLARALRAADVVHLHAHFVNRPVGVAELVEQLTGISYSISAHAKDIYLSPAAVLRRKITHARFTVTCSEYNRRHLLAMAGPGAQVLRIYHGIDSRRFCSDQALSEPSTVPLLLSVGRLRRKKGFDVLIRACAQLRELGLHFRCEIVGYGPEQKRLQTLIIQLELQDTVILAGKLTHEHVIVRYRQATLFVLPCRISQDGDRDGIPNVLLEAMAMELAVVSTRVSGIPEAVRHGHNGMLVPPEDPQTLAEQIRYLLERPDLRRLLGLAGRLIVGRRFSTDTNLEPLRAHLQQAVLASKHDASRARGQVYAQ